MAPGLYNDNDEPDQNRKQGGPDVCAHTEEDFARIDADGLPDDASGAVPDQVEAEQLAPLQPVAASNQGRNGEASEVSLAEAVLAFDEEQHRDAEHIPDDLVQERRVEQGSIRKPGRKRRVARLDLEAPWRVGRKPEEFVVEPVAEASEGLGEQDAGGEGVGKAPEPDTGHPAADDRTNRAAKQRAEDCDATLPDVQGFQQICPGEEVVVGMSEHVENSCADDAEENCPEADVEHDPRLATASNQTVVGHDGCGNHANQDANGIRMDVEVEGEPVEAEVAQPLAEVENLPIIVGTGNAHGQQRGGHLSSLGVKPVGVGWTLLVWKALGQPSWSIRIENFGFQGRAPLPCSPPLERLLQITLSPGQNRQSRHLRIRSPHEPVPPLKCQGRHRCW